MWRSLILGTIAVALFAQAGWAQTAFDVASVKLSEPEPGAVAGTCRFDGPKGIRGGPGSETPGQITASHVSFMDLVAAAYGVHPEQVAGPGWIDPPPVDQCGTPRYDMSAKLPVDTTPAQAMAMWQTLLRERFGLTVGHQKRPVAGFALVIAKGGAKLPMPLSDCTLPAARGLATTTGHYKNRAVPCLVGRSQTMAQLANYLQRSQMSPVWDETGLAGEFDFEIPYGAEVGRPTPSKGLGPLGLELKRGNTVLDMIVVEKANPVPTDN